ncbi:hypothetical protein [Citreimonas salinaria]|uniref:hypothetical protein n=1 Tax=Citreimonas salinaria TaxID=321339 RepID=UPI001C431291|nr:hypothetical protein [Citreimonas salinaria]
MSREIPFHMIERDPFRSLVHWIYIFDYRGRRHLLGLTRIDQGNAGSRILVNRYMVRKGVSYGSLEETPIASECLTMPKNDPAFLDHLTDDPYALGGPVVDFLEQQFCRLIAHTGCSAHEQLRQIGNFMKNLACARASRKRRIPRKAVDQRTMC